MVAIAIVGDTGVGKTYNSVLFAHKQFNGSVFICRHLVSSTCWIVILLPIGVSLIFFPVFLYQLTQQKIYLDIYRKI